MKPKAILLVEDNPSDVELTRRAFSKSGILNELNVVKDGEEALEYLFCTDRYAKRDPDDMPSVVLLDLHLPKIDGFEVLRRIRSNPKTKRLPVVILTTSNEPMDVAVCYDDGANSYIRKPVNFTQFAEAITQLGLYWLVINEVPPPIK